MNNSGERPRVIRAIAHQQLNDIVRSVSSCTLPNSNLIQISLVVPAEWAAIASAALSFMDQTVQEMSRHIERELRSKRTAVILNEHDEAIEHVKKQYLALRASGMKHLRAVHSLVDDPSLPFYGRFKFSDYNWCVKTLSRKPVGTTLKQV